MESEIKPVQPKKSIEAYDSHYQRNKDESFGEGKHKSFEDLLMEEMDEEIDLPDNLAEDLKIIVNLLPLSDQELLVKIKNFHSFGLALLNEAKQTNSLNDSSTAEKQLGPAAKVLFIAAYEYGLIDALTILIKFWKEIDENTTIFRNIHSFFYLIAIKNTLPLKAFKRSLSPSDNITTLTQTKSLRLKTLLHESLTHEFPANKIKKIIDVFNFGG